MIYVTVGVSQGFQRLVAGADRIATNHKEEFLIQTGDTNYTPENADWIDTVSSNEHKQNFQTAKVVVGHAGTGTLLTAMENDVRLVLFPRTQEHDEVFDNHQLQHIHGWSKRLDLTVARTVTDLNEILSTPEEIPCLRGKMEGRLLEEIQKIVHKETKHSNNG